MANHESQISSLAVCLESEKLPFHLTLKGHDTNRKLWLVEPDNFGRFAPYEAQNLVRTLALAHLIAPHLPKIIETNWPVEATEILSGLYEHYKQKGPVIKKIYPQIKPPFVTGEGRQPARLKHASATSGGADSAYRITDCLRRKEGVVGVHIQNLNKGPLAEAIASEKQCRVWQVPYKRIKLVNSSGNGGYSTMRTRDLFIAGLCAVASLPYGIEDVRIEGGMIDNPDRCEYSEYTGAWKTFNRLLTSYGLGIQVQGIDPGEIETVGEIIKIEQELKIPVIALIQNCFSAPYQLPNNRRKWERETPVLSSASPEQWCGSCFKCRRLSLGRLYFADPNLSKVPENETRFFVEDTLRWMEVYRHNEHLMSENFVSHLLELKQRYGFPS